MSISTASARRTLFAVAALAPLALAAPLAGHAAAAPVDTAVYFTSPSGKWHCAIHPDGPEPFAGCRGPVPDHAPLVSGGGVDAIAPNGVKVVGGQPAAFVFYSDTSVDAPGAPVLPYGQIVSAGAFSCAVDEVEGVTCGVREHFFTVSDTAYKLG